MSNERKVQEIHDPKTGKLAGSVSLGGKVSPTASRVPSAEEVATLEAMKAAPADSPLGEAYTAYLKATRINPGKASTYFDNVVYGSYSPEHKAVALKVFREPLLKAEAMRDGLEENFGPAVAKGFLLLNECEFETWRRQTPMDHAEMPFIFELIVRRPGVEEASVTFSSCENRFDSIYGPVTLGLSQELQEKIFTKKEAEDVNAFIETYFRPQESVSYDHNFPEYIIDLKDGRKPGIDLNPDGTQAIVTGERRKMLLDNAYAIALNSTFRGEYAPSKITATLRKCFIPDDVIEEMLKENELQFNDKLDKEANRDA